MELEKQGVKLCPLSEKIGALSEKLFALSFGASRLAFLRPQECDDVQRAFALSVELCVESCALHRCSPLSCRLKTGEAGCLGVEHERGQDTFALAVGYPHGDSLIRHLAGYGAFRLHPSSSESRL